MATNTKEMLVALGKALLPHTRYTNDGDYFILLADDGGRGYPYLEGEAVAEIVEFVGDDPCGAKKGETGLCVYTGDMQMDCYVVRDGHPVRTT